METMSAPPLPRNETPVNIKVPMWFKQTIAQIGAISGEEQGEILIRLASGAAVRELQVRQEQFSNSLPSGDEAPAMANSHPEG